MIRYAENQSVILRRGSKPLTCVEHANEQRPVIASPVAGRGNPGRRKHGSPRRSAPRDDNPGAFISSATKDTIGGLWSRRFERRDGFFAGAQNDNPSGFTFVEVMVALAIFAFAGIVLASAYANVLTAQKAILERNVLAEDCRLVRQALFAESDVQKVSKWNDLPLPAGRSARWRAVVTPTTLPDLFDVVLEIDGLGEGRRSAETIRENLRLLRPTWSNKSERALLLAVAARKIVRHPQP